VHRDENDSAKSEEGKGLFLDSRVKKPGGRSRMRGESEDFRITNNDGGATALLHCEEATKDF